MGTICSIQLWADLLTQNHNSSYSLDANTDFMVPTFLREVKATNYSGFIWIMVLAEMTSTAHLSPYPIIIGVSPLGWPFGLRVFCCDTSSI